MLPVHRLLIQFVLTTYWEAYMSAINPLVRDDQVLKYTFNWNNTEQT